MKKEILITLLFLVFTNSFAQTTKQVAKELVRQGVPHSRIVLAQARLETGNFTSRRCREDHNLFGIKHGKRYARYVRWQDSVTDYKIRISNRYNGKENYYSFLRRIGYASDELYIIKIKHIIKTSKP